jgi:hypothetical protein
LTHNSSRHTYAISPYDLTVNWTVPPTTGGSTIQFLQFNDSNDTYTWEEVSSLAGTDTNFAYNSLTLSGTQTQTFGAHDLIYSSTSGSFQYLYNDGSITNTLIADSDFSTESTDGTRTTSISTTGTLFASINAADTGTSDTSQVVVTNGPNAGIYLNMTNTGLWVGGSEGLANEVLTSNGPGTTPTWQPIAGGGTDTSFATDDLILDNNHTQTFNNFDLIYDSTGGEFQYNSLISGNTTNAIFGDGVSITTDRVSLISTIKHNVTEVTANHTITEGEYMIKVTPNPGVTVNITMPPSPEVGDTYVIKIIDSDGTASVNILGNGSNIDGLAVYPFTLNYQSITLIKTTSEWSAI